MTKDTLMDRDGLTIELKPCPFCGGSVTLEEAEPTRTVESGQRRWWGVVCRNTSNLGGTCAIEQRPSASKEAAIERWNRRDLAAQGLRRERVIEDETLREIDSLYQQSLKEEVDSLRGPHHLIMGGDKWKLAFLLIKSWPDIYRSLSQRPEGEFTKFAYDELVKFYEEWPGGLDEVDSAICNRDEEIHRLRAQLAAPAEAVKMVQVPRDVLGAVLAQYPEFQSDLDETCCPTGFEECPVCEGGGHTDQRKKLPVRHATDSCPNKVIRELLLAAAPERGEGGGHE